MMPMLRIFGLTLPVAPTFILLAFVVGSDIGARALGRAAPTGQRAQWNGWFSSAAFWAAVLTLIVARLSYALLNLSLYRDSPGLLFSIRPGAFAPWPGIIAGLSLFAWSLRRRAITWSHIGDALAVGATAAWVVLSLRDFLTGEAYGLPTTLPWGINLWQAVRHPVQLYEMVAALLVLALLWFYQTRVAPGVTFWRFVALFGVGKLLVEAFRAAALTLGPGWRIAQVEAFATLLIGLFVLSFYARPPATAPDPTEQTQPL